MYARANSNLAEFPGIFGDGDYPHGTPIRINLNEFSYKKGNEIFGEKEPAADVGSLDSAVRSGIEKTEGGSGCDRRDPHTTVLDYQFRCGLARNSH